MLKHIIHKPRCLAPNVRTIPAWVLQEDKTYAQISGCDSCGETTQDGWPLDKKEVE